MAAQYNSQDERRFFVRLLIGVSAQFRVQTHQEVTFDNLRNYFKGLNIEQKENVISFLDDAKAMGCTMLDYHNPLSANSNVFAEFEVEVPEDKVDEFRSKYARYSYLF